MIKKLSFQHKMIFTIVTIILFEVGIMGLVSGKMFAEIVENQLSKRVLDVAISIANMPFVAELVESKDPEGELSQIINNIRIKTGAKFIVIGDKDGIRLVHPKTELLGTYMSGGDNDPALLEGKSYNSRASGSFGPSLRGKSAIKNTNGQIVGIVSVGYLDVSINQKIAELQNTIIGILLLLIIVGILSTLLIARGIKTALHGLQPEEIGRLFSESNAIIESIHEGIVSINQQSVITIINQKAIDTLMLDKSKSYIGMPLLQVMPDKGLLEVLDTGENQLNALFKYRDTDLIVNRIAILDGQEIMGAVSSFRIKDEIELLAQELSQTQEYAIMLRQQTHEYSNKLHTIAGLIQLEAYPKAIELISNETSNYSDILKLLVEVVPDPIVAGCILGKYNRAQELGVTMTFDTESHFADIPEHISRDAIVTILGNLLDNAYQATLGKPSEQRIVQLSLIDIGKNLIIEVEDSGNGVPEDIANNIYNLGFSTKSKQDSDSYDNFDNYRGVGLYLVTQTIANLNGEVTLTESSLGGACFTVYLPKELT